MKLKTKITKDCDFDKIKFIQFTLYTDDNVIVGKAMGFLFSFKEDDFSESQFLDLADSISEDCFETTKFLVLETYEWDEVDKPRYFYLDRICIDEAMRNKGFGTKFIEKIEKYLKNKANFIYLKPYPFEEKDKKDCSKYIERLQYFYLDNDYKIIYCFEDNDDECIAIKEL